MLEVDLMSPSTPRLPSEWIAHRQGTLVELIESEQRAMLRRRRLIVTGGAIVLLAIGIVLTIGSFGGSSAYAGWSPDPTQPTASQMASATTACQEDITTVWQSGNSLTPSDPAFPKQLPPFVVGDFRGPYSALLYQDSHDTFTCLVSTTSSHAIGLTGGSGLFFGTPSDTTPVAMSTPALMTDNGAPLQLVEGETLRDVTSLSFTLSNGTTVSPTLEHGYFLVWWPGTASISTTTYEADGSAHQLDLGTQGPSLSPPAGG
jgi:hypothetical protein